MHGRPVIPVRLQAGQYWFVIVFLYCLPKRSGMNAPTFDTHPSVCPICHHANVVKSRKLFKGLLVCDHCRERLVVSWSGHYVRDPFRLRHRTLERSLRRESHPFYRILRDLKLTHFNVWVALLAGTVCIGIFGALSEQFATEPSKDIPSPTQPQLRSLL